MRNLFVCCDGTWNLPTNRQDGVPVPTNVYKFFVALADRSPKGEQRFYYHPGVGTEGSYAQRLKDGMTGDGLDNNVKSAYKWLADTYEEGDRIFLLGFSRGAYTVRALCGFIHHSGLVQRATWKQIVASYDRYLDNEEPVRMDASGRKEKHGFWRKAIPANPPKQNIHFIGVWDTVGALGIPLNLPFRIWGRGKRAFHDVRLPPTVGHAYHALAMDERRGDFAPTLWAGPFAPGQTVEQRWFPGVHSDIGGGYKEHGLSDAALIWMIKKAQKCGAAFKPSLIRQIKPDHQGVLHDSVEKVFKLLEQRPRSVPEVVRGEHMHESTLERQADPPIEQTPYRPSKRLEPGKYKECYVYADEPWNATDLYVKKGEHYSFKAEGEWIHGNFRTDPEGVKNGLANWLLGLFKRDKKSAWFSLEGYIGDISIDKSGTPAPMTFIDIGDGQSRYTIPTEGYLYCFANDNRRLLGKSRGGVKLTITRVESLTSQHANASTSVTKNVALTT